MTAPVLCHREGCGRACVKRPTESRGRYAKRLYCSHRCRDQAIRNTAISLASDKTRTVDEIADLAGVPKSTAWAAITKHGLPYARRRIRIPQELCEAAARLYAEHKTWDEIAAAVGVDRTQVGAMVRRTGAELRRYAAAIPAIILLFASPAVAQETLPLIVQGDQRCGDYAAIAAELAERYREQRIASGLDANGNVIAVFASRDGETYTVLRVQPTGPACIVSAGTSWEALPTGEPA
jgi:hypothetical protein